MNSYFDHMAAKTSPDREDVSLDVVEFDQPDSIAVQARTFDTHEDLLAHIARESGRPL